MSGPSALVERLRRGWWPDVAAGALTLVAGYLEFALSYYAGTSFSLVVPIALAAGLARRLPAIALGVVWLLAVLHLVGGVPVLYTELGVVGLVAFATGRWGSRATAFVAGASIPAVVLLGLALVVVGRLVAFDPVYVGSDLLVYGVLGGAGYSGSLVTTLVVLGLPYLTGLALRSQARADDSRRSQVVAETELAQAQVEADQAQEIARLRDDQARMARDVHDVVGHSLAVILAQAESAQYLPDDPTQLKSTLATIATSARASLQDVRQVLSQTQAPAGTRTGRLEDLVEGIRASGQEVVVREEGPAQPLPPELEVVAHRVLQEMLTNAVKHGVRGRPIIVERHWPGGGFERDLRIEVRNAESSPTEETQPITVSDPTPGQGLEGMRRRVESVGGRLDVRRRVEAGDPTFTTTAWVPVSRHE